MRVFLDEILLLRGHFAAHFVVLYTPFEELKHSETYSDNDKPEENDNDVSKSILK